MKPQKHKLIFHTKTENGWQPGTFSPTMFLTEDAANTINRIFPESGVKAIPGNEKREFVRGMN